jgi:hypothetical protein
MNRQSLAVGIVFVLCLCAAVQANPLNLTVPHDPWVLTDAVYVQYTLTGADTGHLLAYGCPTTYNDGPESTVTLNPYYSYFELNLDLYTSGEPIGGSLTLSGATDNNPTPPVLFYSTLLNAFGYGADDKFECILTQEGPGVPQEGDLIGVILIGTSIPGDPDTWFTDAFNNNYNGQADVFYLPEPATLVVLAIGALGLLGRRK